MKSIFVFLMTMSVMLVPPPIQAQEYILFEVANEPSDSVFGWDLFVGGYPGPHASSLDDAGGVLTVSPAGGLISSTGNLYAFFTIPTYTVSLNDLETSEAFTSVVVQVATTEVLDESRFSLVPDEFEFLGARASLDFDGDQIPINYYWAEWNGMTASPDFEVSVSGAAEHVSFCSVRASHFNTAEPLNVTFGKAVLLGDVNCDGSVNLLDVGPFVDLISAGEYLDKADMNQDGQVNLLDVGPFVAALAG